MSNVHTMKRYIIFVSIILVSLVLISTETRASMALFDDWAPITSNSGYQNEFAQGLSLVVTDEGVASGEILFTFYNNSPIDTDPDNDGVDDVGPGAITDIYFDDGSLLSISTNINENPPDVDFGIPAVPSNLPSGNTVDPPFVATTGFSADAENAPAGVDVGESVGIIFDIGSNSFTDVIDAIQLGFQHPGTYDQSDPWYSNSLRIGLHVSNLGLDSNGDGEPGDFSDGFILTPIPPSIIIGLLGMGVAGIKLRKFA